MSKTEFNATTTSEEVIERFASEVKGRTFVITGTAANSIGGYTALKLAGAGAAHIVLVSRTPKTVQPVIEEIESEPQHPKVTFVQCDLADQDSVRAAAATILEAAPAIDVLINNAGIMAIPEYTLDKHGIEIQLSANHVGHFLLTNLLVPALAKAAQANSSGKTAARVVNLTSTGHRISPVRFDDPGFSGGKAYHPFSGYGQSKTANILFAVGLNRRLRGRGVTSTAVHPGEIHSTGLGVHIKLDPEGYAAMFKDVAAVSLRDAGRPWPDEVAVPKPLTAGAATTLVAALDPEIPARSPAYLADAQIGEPYDYTMDPRNAEKLWKLSEEWVGQKFEY